jgi:hypothetical protein
MTTSPAEANERNKAIKRLMETWKKSPSLLRKALHLIDMNAVPKNRKRKSFLIP